MNKKNKLGLLLVSLSLLTPVHITTTPNLLCFVKGLLLSLGMVLIVKGIIERRKERAQ